METKPAISPDFAATYRDMFLQSLAKEMQITKKVIAAVPETARDYRHDPKSMSALDLAWHLVGAEVMFLNSIADLKFSMEGRSQEKPVTVASVIEWYDSHFTPAAARVQALTPEQLMTPVEFFGVAKLPVVLYLGILNNHSIHHRGQLSTYLRPMGSKVPSIYGGSADEPFQH